MPAHPACADPCSHAAHLFRAKAARASNAGTARGCFAGGTCDCSSDAALNKTCPITCPGSAGCFAGHWNRSSQMATFMSHTPPVSLPASCCRRLLPPPPPLPLRLPQLHPPSVANPWQPPTNTPRCSAAAGQARRPVVSAGPDPDSGLHVRADQLLQRHGLLPGQVRRPAFRCCSFAAMHGLFTAVSTAVDSNLAVIISKDGSLLGQGRSGNSSRRRECHFTDIRSHVLLKRLLKGEGGAAE